MSSQAAPALLRSLAGETLHRPPIWFMRQAGRFLPEYRALRATAGDFLSLCFDPAMAAEATLQPMRRFAFDAAIVFADILLIPLALGQEVRFEAGEGPVLGPLPETAALADRVEETAKALASIGETVERVRASLEPERALIGFAGGPWTVATYMIEGRGGEDARVSARAHAARHPDQLEPLLDVLAEATWRYLVMQVEAGAQATQLFESWSEQLSDELFEKLVTGPHAKIVGRLRQAGVTAPVIGFPRGATPAQVERYAGVTGVQAVSLGSDVPLDFGRRLQGRVTLQGALDNGLLLAGGPALDAAADALLDAWGGGPWIFNLGHGIMPQTPIAHVQRVVDRVTGWRGA